MTVLADAVDTPTAVIALDPAGKVAGLNSAAASLLGVTGEPPSGCDLSALGRWIGDPAFGAALDRLAQRSEVTTTAPLRMKRGSGPIAATLLPPGSARHGSDGPTALILLTPWLRRSSVVARPVWLATAALGIAVAGWAAAVLPGAVATATTTAPPSPTAPIQTAAPTPRLSMVGVIEPSRTVNVIAPFAGTVKEKRFDYGASVERGDRLLVLDGLELEMRMRDAEAALLKAGQRLEELKDWANGADVSRARRQAETAAREAEQAQQRLREAKPLIDQGIIPRQEYEDLRRQATAQAVNLAAAREDLAVVAKKGDRDARLVAELEFANAKAKAGELKTLLDRATVTAPASGLALKPPSGASSGPSAATAIEAGGALAANQILLVLADLERLSVAARVDEMDVGRLHVGQIVEVSSDALADGPLMGRIGWVAQQATVSDNGSPNATFAIRVDLPPLTERQGRNVRVGMSANVSILAPVQSAN
ncbi:multidrug resistance efflux pump [Azospirillum agricola]|uniref:HlyD family secretion protein n=1 Tax=Azospirillum agricola TaxID=1720247 RepID=UPI001AE6E7EE|nr:HlyD family efflux transporter periplasmic adaptor subunit [Azospirillum agricola]MBP2232586.1 multidrug resistance efflux pump [Azospirillum agricola]